MAVNLYGKSLFGAAYKSAVTRGANNAPAGDGGFDVDVQYNLGAPRRGICCGITIAWIIGVCHDRDDAAKRRSQFQLHELQESLNRAARLRTSPSHA